MLRLDTARVSRKSVILTCVVLVGLVAGGVAIAAWSSSPTGAGRSGALTAIELDVTASTGAADLFPGTTQGDVYFTVTNPNPYPVTFTSMAPAGPITNSVAGDATACPPTHVMLASATGLSLTVTPNSTSPALSIPNVVSMDSAAPDGCQANPSRSR